MKSLKYIIKRIIIGTGIALALMFIKQNVYAYEWEAQGDQQLDFITDNYPVLSQYWIYTRSSSSPSYPISFNSSFDKATAPSLFGVYSSDISLSRLVGPSMVTAITMDFDTYVFQPDTYYYLVIPFGYNSNNFSSLSSNFNGYDLTLDSTYSINNGNISSVVFSFGSDNDYELTNDYSYLMYFKILFTVSEQTSNLVITIGDTSSKTATFTAFNTTTFKDYIWKYNMTCASYTSSTCSYKNSSTFTPLLYTGTPGSPILDGNDLISDSSSDIKTKIGEIINGTFSENLDFPYMNGGGLSFGDNTYSFQDLLVMPLQFFQNIVDSSVACSPLSLPFPGLSGTMVLECPTTFATAVLGSTIVDMIKLILGVVIGFKIVQSLYKSVLNILDPTKMSQVQDIF